MNAALNMIDLQRDEQRLAADCIELLDSEVAILFGGQSSEREVSLQSGQTIIDCLQSTEVPILPIDASDSLAQDLQSSGVKHAFNILHGAEGEDGTITALLQSMGIGCTGSGVLGSALAMDKLRSKWLWQGAAVPTPDFEYLGINFEPEEVLERLKAPIMVKPCSGGSSLGMSLVDDANELLQAAELARQFDPHVMAEAYIDGREFSVSLLGETILPAVELGTDAEFYDYEAKYVSNDTRYDCPVDLPASELEEMEHIAQQAFARLACSGWGRVDFMQDRHGRFWVLEVNTTPGMTAHSIFPMAAKAIDLSLTALVLHILLNSLQLKEGVNV